MNKYSKEYLDEICESGNAHLHEDQKRRQISALTVSPIEINHEQKKGRFRGSSGQIYETDETGCTCKDFALRQLPCKHMYRLAHECGLFEIAGIANNDGLERFNTVASLSDDLCRTFVDMSYFTFYGLKNAQKDIDSAKNESDLAKARQTYEKRKILSINEEHVLEWDIEYLLILEAIGLLHVDKSDSAMRVCLSCVDDTDFMEDVLKIYSKKHIPIFRHYTTSNPAKLLDEMIENASIGSNKSIRRSAKLLRPHDAEETDSWVFCVPKCFNDALDIRLSQNKLNTVSYAIWTQGINFAFQKDDMIYDAPKACRNWKDCLESMSVCLHVDSATPAAPARKNKVEGTDKQVVVETFPGSVSFRILRPDTTKTKLEHVETRTVTQHEFVRVLINGL